MIQNKTIFIAHNWYDISVSGQSKALAFAYSKFNKVYFLNAKKSNLPSQKINDNLMVLQWPGKRPTGWKDFFFAFKLIRQFKPDIIVTHFAANDIMLFVSWLLRVPVRICHYHTMVEQYIEDFGKLDIAQKINIFRKGFVFRMATHMLACSSAAKKDLIKFYKVKEHKAFVFANALPDNNFINKSNNYKIGFLGRLDRSKGADILLEAFEKVIVKCNNATLEIAGEGLEKEKLEKIVRTQQLENKVTFKGKIPYNEILTFLASVNFLVVPSRSDNLPTVALEALSVFTPVIGSDAGGIPDIITSGYNGLLFENTNADDLAHKMLLLLQNREKRESMAVNAAKSFYENYSLQKFFERFENLLETTKTK